MWLARGVTHAIAKLGDWMLSRLVPSVQAAAACNIGHVFIRTCGCNGNTRMAQECEVVRGCKTLCGSCFPYSYCL